MKKITLATVKKFIRENTGKIMIMYKSDFDAMTDGVRYENNPKFVPVEYSDEMGANSLGIKGAWFVGQSRDWFTPFKNESFTGIHVSNCCGSFTLAIPK